MTDHLSPEKRSWNMKRIKASDTKPEKAVRSELHRLGFRFRLHRNELPGTPDIVLPKYKTVIFVHGCFWHRHKNCKKTTIPSTNTDYWKNKFERNVKRDERNKESLIRMGWKVIIVWSCETKEISELGKRLEAQIRTEYLSSEYRNEIKVAEGCSKYDD